MRDIKHIVLHCTATPQLTTVESIKRYWREKWENPGYHYLIDVIGRVHNLQPEEKIANGVRGYNQHSIHISYVGGLEKDDRTPRQKTAMYNLCVQLAQKYPNAELLGHCDFPDVAKHCPRFDARKWFNDHPISLTT